MRPGAAAIVALAAAVRTAAALWAGDAGLYFPKFPLLADRLLAGGWLPPTPFAYSPAYTYLVAAVHAVLGPEPAALTGVQIALDCLAVAALGVIARQLWGRTTATAAALAAAVAAALVLQATSFESDGLGLALTLAGIAAAATGCRRRTLGWQLLAGLLLGLRVCQRPNGVLIVLGAAAVLALDRWCDRRSRRLVAAVTLLAAAAVPAAAVAALNSRAAHRPSLALMSSAGWVLYTSHNHAASGLGYAPPPLALELKRAPTVDPVASMDAAVSERIASWVVGRQLAPAEASAFWRREALASVRRRGAVAQLARQLTRLELAIHRYEAVDNPAAAARWQDLRRWPLLGAGLLLPLGLAGLARRTVHGGRWRPGEWLLVVVAGSSLVSMSLFYVASRFRLELLAALLPFAAWGAVDALGPGGRRSRLADGVWLGTLALLLALSNLPNQTVATHHRRAVIRLETVRGDRADNPAGAVLHYRRATAAAVYPAEAGPAYQRLAALLPRLGDLSGARTAERLAAGFLPEATREAFTARPGDPDASWALGRDRLLQGRPGPAAASFRAALDLRPLDPDLQFALAVALAEAGGSAAEIRELTAAALADGLRFSSSAPRAWRLLAASDDALGDHPAAAAAEHEASRLLADSSTLLGAPGLAADG